MKYYILSLLLISTFWASAQEPDRIYNPNIRSVKLYRAGDIYSYPIINLNSAELLDLHFDDLDGDIAPNQRLVRAVHHAIAALADLFAQLVALDNLIDSFL